ncbi:MAG TPA: hypothetical protein VF116_00545 [Ktedonobacterales bacterium]
MSTPRDHPTTPLPGRGSGSVPYGPDEPTIQMRSLADLGQPDARPEAPTIADLTAPNLPAVRPSQPLMPRSASSRLVHKVPWRDLRGSQGAAILIAACVFFFAFVLVLTALVLRPILSLFPGPGVPRPAAAATATSLPTATATATPSPTAIPPANTATFVTLDTTTQGNWQGVYGSAGYMLAGDATQQLPAAIQVTPSGAAPYTWAASTDDARAPVKPENSDDRIAACWYSFTSFTIDVNITDGQTYQLALYLLDWDQQNRVETVSVVDGSSGTALDTRPVSGFGNGEYLVWQVRGHVSIQVINAAGSLNAVVSALFFAPAASA